MKKHTPTFYSNNQNKLLLNTPAYELIFPLIEYATVSRHRDVVVLELVCPGTQQDVSAFIQNGKDVGVKTACRGCIHRLRTRTGGKCEQFKPIEKEKPEDFSYLISYLEEKKVCADSEISVYLDMLFASYEESVSDFEDITFQEYRLLVSFFNKLGKSIDTLHGLRGWFRKIFR